MAKKANTDRIKAIVADAKKIRKEAGTKQKTVTEFSMGWNTALKKAGANYKRTHRTDAPIGNEGGAKPKPKAAAKKKPAAKPKVEKKK